MQNAVWHVYALPLGVRPAFESHALGAGAFISKIIRGFMSPGEIVARGHDLYVVLATKDMSAALAPLVLTKRNRTAHAVPVRAGALGEGYVLAASARVDTGHWEFSGYCVTLRDLEMCQMAARRAQADKTLAQRYAPFCAFEQAMPRLKPRVEYQSGLKPVL